uniref:dynein regulatory complex subunit 6-like isoform X1 n=1 Tax=Styela clava TaxID=7725 RepID=UPI00193A6A74|nr:dynein regulatory complex subunit 6-like isoform X1 [Styela clava]
MMDNLPIEIWSEILKYLNLADRRECALVCKKFYEASLDPDLHWKSTYIFDAQALLPQDEFTEAAFDNQIYCKSPNLYINGLDENINVKPLLNPQNGHMSLLGPHVVRLSLKGSSILESSFVEILNKCDSLESLDITSCNAMFMSGSFLAQSDRHFVVAKVLEKTVDLNLSSIRYMNDDILKKFYSLCPSLSSIKLACCNILFSEFGSTQRFALTFPCIVQLASVQCSTLTRIDLSRTGITNFALAKLSSIKGLKLKEVVLKNCRELGDAGVSSLAKQQPDLRVIDIRSCCEVGNAGVSAICTSSHNLRELYLAKCRKVTDISASKISFLEKLEILDISECYDITTTSISVILTLLTALSTLIANGCNFAKFHTWISKNQQQNEISEKKVPLSLIPKDCFQYLNLTKLSINSGKHVTDLTIQSIFVYLTNLKQLSLSWCHYITDRGLLGLNITITDGMTFPNVKDTEAHILSTGRYSRNHSRIGFLGSPGAEYISYVDWSEVDVKSSLPERGITRLRKLQRLSMSNCPNVTDESLVRIFCVGQPVFPKMEHLELNMMQRSITNDVVNGITIGCPLLTYLAMSGSNISNDGVAGITQRLHRLEKLDLSNCDNITPKFFHGLIKNNRWLRELDISSCKQIPESSADKLKKSLPLLARVHTRYSGV